MDSRKLFNCQECDANMEVAEPRAEEHREQTDVHAGEDIAVDKKHREP